MPIDRVAVKNKAGARTLLHPSMYAHDCIVAALEAASTTPLLRPAPVAHFSR